MEATRATKSEAMLHFQAGGSVLVSEHGHELTRPVGPTTTIHNREATTWEALTTEVATWSNRYPNQRFYIIPTEPAPANVRAMFAGFGWPTSEV